MLYFRCNLSVKRLFLEEGRGTVWLLKYKVRYSVCLRTTEGGDQGWHLRTDTYRYSHYLFVKICTGARAKEDQVQDGNGEQQEH